VQSTESALATSAVSTIHVMTAEVADQAEWQAFIIQHAGASLFHDFRWGRVIERVYGYRPHYLIAKTGDEIRGVLPLVDLKTPLFGRALVSVAFFVYGGILAVDEAAALALAESAAELGDRLGVDYVELRGEAAALPDWTTKSGTYATFRRTIAVAEDDNLKQIPRKKRADVRKSIKSDLDVATFYRTYAESVRNLGTPVFPQRFAAAIVDEFGDMTELSMVCQKGQPLAVLMSFFFKDQVLPYYGGALPAARPTHAYDRQYWSLMRRAVERGATVFDFGRSKYGTRDFIHRTMGHDPTCSGKTAFCFPQMPFEPRRSKLMPADSQAQRMLSSL